MMPSGHGTLGKGPGLRALRAGVTPGSGPRPEDPRAPHALPGDPRVSPAVRQVIRAWARRIPGAPRALDQMVQLVREDHEEVLRVVTEVHRRDVLERRAPAPRDAYPRRSPVFVDPHGIDPWALSPEELRRSSEKIDGCSTCHGRGCATCGGSGLEITWLACVESARYEVRVEPARGLVDQYPHLAEQRFFTHDDVAPFLVYAEAMSDGVLGSGALAYDELDRVRALTPTLDRRVERVARQQYVRLGTVRREVAFELMGKRGGLVIDGGGAIEAGEDALGPLRARLLAWLAGGAASIVALLVVYSLLRGTTAYFAAYNAALAALLLAAAAGAVGIVGAATRMVGARMRIQRPLRREIGYAGAFGVALAGAFLAHAVSRPTATEARAAMSRGDSAASARVIDALESTGADPLEISGLRDDLAIAEATRLSGDARLTRLDDIASQGGARASEAARLAREERIARVKGLVAQQKLTDALELWDQIFLGAQREDPDALEAKASIFEAELAQCKGDPCSFLAARKAERAHPTPERKLRAAELRGKLTALLTIVLASDETPLVRLQRARALDEAGKSVEAVAGDDAELMEKARTARRWAEATRAAVSLLGAERPVLEELLGALADAPDGNLRATSEGVAVYLTMDPRRATCAGVYVVGDTKDARQQGISANLPGALLTRTLGHPATVKPPVRPTSPTAAAPVDVSWTDGGVPIVTRWRDDVFVEMRVGDADPGGAPIPARPRATWGRGALVKIVAFPGGRIFVDGVAWARDATAPARFHAGKHEIVVKNRFLGDVTHPIDARDGQNDTVVIVW